MKRSRHGLNALKARVTVRGLRAVDRRTSAGRALMGWREELVAALGGDHEVTPQEAALVEAAARTRLFLDHLDAWLLEQPSLILARKRSVVPVLRERQQLADSLARLLGQLGLRRRAKPVRSLSEIVAAAAAMGTTEPAVKPVLQLERSETAGATTTTPAVCEAVLPGDRAPASDAVCTIPSPTQGAAGQIDAEGEA